MYVIDDGRTGWVKVYYNRPDEKELPAQNGFAIARVGPDMKLFTRSRMNPSWEASHFFYQTSDGKRVELFSKDGASRRIWGEEKNSGTDTEQETFFVGDQTQFSKRLNSQFADGIVGEVQTGTEAAQPASDPGKDLTDLEAK